MLRGLGPSFSLTEEHFLVAKLIGELRAVSGFRAGQWQNVGMSDEEPVYVGFLGTWFLDTNSCDYEQSEPPRWECYTIAEVAGRLQFAVNWTDSDGESHHVEFSGRANAGREQFAGGDLADTMVIEAPSPRELTSRAYYRDRELMTAQRQLDDTGTAMRVVQQVRLPDGTRSTNVGIYRKKALN